MKKIHTYIGICDFMSQKQVLDIAEIFRHIEYSGIQLMVGTMTSFKVLNNQETKWTKIYPAPKILKEIFSVRSRSIINCLHYVDYENHPKVSETLCSAVGFCGEKLDALQLNMVWPDPKELEKFHAQHAIPLVLQVSKRAMTECFDNPHVVAKKIRDEYSDIISHVLFDYSMGKDVPINVHLIEGYIDCLKMYAGGVDVAVAGGLGPQSVHEVKRLIELYRVSIDAQSNLRLSGKAEDPIDWDLARKYVHKAIGYYL